MKKNLPVFSLSFLAILGLMMTGQYNRFSQKNNPAPVPHEGKVDISNLHDSKFFEYKEDVEKSLFEAEKKEIPLEMKEVQIGITSHHLPVAAPLIASLYRSLLSSKGPRDTFVILGPDHFEKCKSRIALTENGYRTPFGEIGINQDIVDKFKNQGFSIDDNCFEGEHSISVQAIFVRSVYPKARVVSILLSSGTSEEDIEKLSELLFELEDQVSVITSVDFSHYNRYEEANQLDRKSEKMIGEMRGDLLKLKNVDSPPAVKVALNLARKMGYNDVQVISRANSYEYSGRKESTTGYMSIIFQK